MHGSRFIIQYSLIRHETGWTWEADRNQALYSEYHGRQTVSDVLAETVPCCVPHSGDGKRDTPESNDNPRPVLCHGERVSLSSMAEIIRWFEMNPAA